MMRAGDDLAAGAMQRGKVQRGRGSPARHRIETRVQRECNFALALVFNAAIHQAPCQRFHAAAVVLVARTGDAFARRHVVHELSLQKEQDGLAGLDAPVAPFEASGQRISEICVRV